jgi:hypothetical protein
MTGQADWFLLSQISKVLFNACPDFRHARDSFYRSLSTNRDNKTAIELKTPYKVAKAMKYLFYTPALAILLNIAADVR